MAKKSGKGFGKTNRPDVAKLFTEAVNWHQKGQLEKALQNYQEILAVEPLHLDVLSNLGSLYKSLGKFEESISFYRKALELKSDRAETWFNFGNALQAQKLLQEAEEAFSKSVELNPNLGVGFFNLGRVKQEREKLLEAAECYQKAISLIPNLVRAHTNLGNVFKSLGRFDEAIASHQRALQLQADNPEIYYNLGNAFREKKQYADAASAYKQAISLRKNFAEAWLNLAGVLQLQGASSETEQVLQQALVNIPELIPAYLSLNKLAQERGDLQAASSYLSQGLAVRPDDQQLTEAILGVLQLQGRLDKAIVILQQQIERNPNASVSFYYLGLIYNELGKFNDAIPCLKKAIELNPQLALALASLGYSLIVTGQLSEAITYCQKAIEINSNLAIAYLNMGFALNNQGKIVEAVECFEKCLEIEPNYYPAHANLLYAINYDSRFTKEFVASRHQKWGISEQEKYGIKGRKKAPIPKTKSQKNKILRVGYVSPDFRQHSVAYFIQPILANHDPESVEIFGYASVAVPDAITDRLRYLAHHWHDVSRLNDEQLSKLIQFDNIDILVDLAGHTGKSRLPVFARKPAPIQVTYLGYPNTTGLKCVDYRITDHWVDPPEFSDKYYTETILRLNRCFLCYNPPTGAPTVNELPAKNIGKVTFGSFNNVAKLTFEVVSLWAEILKQLPNSRLILKSHGFEDEQTKKRYIEMFAAFGIDNHRLWLVGAIPDPNYHLAFYGNIDIALDPFPYNGTTTTCEALWMGVPVITLAGEAHAGRVGVSLLTSVGLSEFITASPEEYITKCVALANNQDYLSELRPKLRQKVANSPLCDGVDITRSLEEVYRQIWQGLL